MCKSFTISIQYIGLHLLTEGLLEVHYGVNLVNPNRNISFGRYSDDKSVSSRSSFDASFEQKGEDGDHFTERGRSKQRYYPGSRGFTGKYDR